LQYINWTRTGIVWKRYKSKFPYSSVFAIGSRHLFDFHIDAEASMLIPFCITLSTTAVCKLCVVEYFCEAKPHKRDLQTVQPRSGVLLRLVKFFFQLAEPVGA